VSTTKFSCQFETDTTGRVCIVSLSGSLDPLATEELGPKLQEQYAAGFRRYVFDLTQLAYVGSLGIRLLVGLSNQVKGEGALALCNLTSGVKIVVELTKLDKVLRIFPNRADALGAVRDA
jgi:anti-sigma B factor antagonist